MYNCVCVDAGFCVSIAGPGLQPQIRGKGNKESPWMKERVLHRSHRHCHQILSRLPTWGLRGTSWWRRTTSGWSRCTTASRTPQTSTSSWSSCQEVMLPSFFFPSVTKFSFLSSLSRCEISNLGVRFFVSCESSWGRMVVQRPCLNKRWVPAFVALLPIPLNPQDIAPAARWECEHPHERVELDSALYKLWDLSRFWLRQKWKLKQLFSSSK